MHRNSYHWRFETWQGNGKHRFGRFKLSWLMPVVLAQILLMASAAAGPVFDTSSPAAFFTNVASRLLSSELNVNLGRIEIYPTNQYTPSVHRLLQVTANILDAQNTNFYPSVFRPLFSKDASNDIFITGYQQVGIVSGQNDPQLSTPYPVTALLDFSADDSPITNANGPVNVYGVPWVVGVKKGLPNFNQFSLLSAAQFTRKLEILRSSTVPATAMYVTNQMYIIGISNALGVSFWNSYSAAYPRPLTVFVSDVLSTTLTNGAYTWSETTNFIANNSVSSWPGSQWSGSLASSRPSAAAFLNVNWYSVFQPPLAYDFNTAQFDPLGQWQSTTPPLPQLPQFGLSVTNYLQAFILDGSNVIDYVQFCAPTVSGNLNQALADPNFPEPNNIFYQWSTNVYPPAPPTSYGVINQLYVSGHPNSAPTAGGQWSTAPTPMGVVTPSAEAAYFNGFFTPSFQYNGFTYVNTALVQQTPYTPSRTVFMSLLLQANDPLVHYLTSDLNSQVGALAIWNAGQSRQNGTWNKSDDPIAQPLPTPPVTPIGGRYQPWGQNKLMALQTNVDTNAYNLAFKDPLVWWPDYWNFPTNQTWNLNWLGQVHRGTPWQTIYLKSSNILASTKNVGNLGAQNIGTNTWANWTGDLQHDSVSGQFVDATESAPVMDWQLVSLLAALLNTNDLRTQFSVNTPDPGAWAAQFDGMIALTNVAAIPLPQFASITISSNSDQASIMANAIESIRAGSPGQLFHGIGDVLATPQLTVQSPFLNLSNYVQQNDGVSDQAYEAIPSQLLPLLRADSVGQLFLSNGQALVQFSGYDGHTYVVEVSADLLNWTNASTNCPVNGIFSAPVPPVGNTSMQFYRSLLLQ